MSEVHQRTSDTTGGDHGGDSLAAVATEHPPSAKLPAGPRALQAPNAGRVLVLLFAANLSRTHLGTEIAGLFMASMLAIGTGFAVFLIETTVAARAVRVRSDLLQHRVDEGA